MPEYVRILNFCIPLLLIVATLPETTVESVMCLAVNVCILLVLAPFDPKKC